MSGSDERAQVAVIGGGVIGTAVLRALAERGIDAVLVETEPSVGEWASKANSAIVHTGFDARPGSVEGDMLSRAREMWPSVIESLGVPFLQVGALMLARDEGEWQRLRQQVVANALAMGVETQLLDRTELLDLAPYVNELHVGALLVPGESVVDPFWLTRRYAESAVSGGARVRTGGGVIGLDLDGSRVVLSLDDGGVVHADQVIDCAGLGAAAVARLAGDDSFDITPRKGQFLVSEETYGIDRIVLPLPGPNGKGMLVTPIVFGGLLLGPTAEDQADPTDRSTDARGRDRILESTSAMVPAVSRMRAIRQFAGLRPVCSTGDYVLRPSKVDDRLAFACGIRSTGISSSPAVAEAVADLVCELRGWDRRPRSLQPIGMSFDREPGRIVCPCRSVSHGEVESACAGDLGARTLDAVKRASGAMFGDCQGNQCVPAVAGVLAANGATEILKGVRGSWALLAAGSREDVHGPTGTPNLPARVDVAVIGGGLAGIGAALAALDGGADGVLIVERAGRLGGALRAWTAAMTDPEREAITEALERRDGGDLQVALQTDAVSVLQLAGGWQVAVQRATGGAEIAAGRVILACGGYVQPREHLAVEGPRCAGIWTADLAHTSLDAGWLPGRRGLVVGDGRYATATADRLRDAGVRVEMAGGQLRSVRGGARLEAVEVDGSWYAVDSLFLARSLVPAPFLLRPLGLVDNRPGSGPESDANGTVMPGLQLAGTVRSADIDHLDSLTDGRRAGELAVRA